MKLQLAKLSIESLTLLRQMVNHEIKSRKSGKKVKR